LEREQLQPFFFFEGVWCFVGDGPLFFLHENDG